MEEIFKEKVISKLTLGAVQLGMDYGIANKNGKPSREDSWNLLTTALEQGITSIDTARHYGSSEDVIGGFENPERFNVITKFKLDRNVLRDTQMAMDEARKSALQSCKTLKIERIPIFLFHQDRDYPIDVVADLLPDIFHQLKSEGLIDMGGISVYHPGELEFIKDWQMIQAVQVPMNVFDLRLMKDGLMQKLIKNGTIVFIRSVFLQGLLLMDIESLPQHLVFAKPYLQKLVDLAKQSKMDITQLVFSYVRDTPGVTSMVIGAENTDQVKENAKLLKGAPLTQEIRTEIEKLFIDVPEKLITPGFWTT